MRYYFVLFSIMLFGKLFAQEKEFKFDSIYLNHEKTKEAFFLLDSSGMANRFTGDFKEFKGKYLNGDGFSSSNIKKIAVIDFWFTGCAPCLSQIPLLNVLKEKYKGYEVDFIAVTFEDTIKLNSFLKKQSFNFEHVIVNKQELTTSFKNMSYPTTIVVKDNKIIYSKTGFLSDPKSPYYYIMMNLTYYKFDKLLEKSIKK